MRRALKLLGPAWTLLASAAWAQQVTVGSPFNTAGDSFYESFGTSWGVRQGNFFFNFGGGGAIPPFGGYRPASGANVGWGWGGNGLNGYFFGSMAQGSNRSIVSQTPSITLTPGYPGVIADASQSPFVIGTIPVVGGFPAYGAPSLPGFNPGAPAMQYIPETGSGNPRLDAIRRGAQGGDLGQAIDPATRPRAAAGARGDLTIRGDAPLAVADPGAEAIAEARTSSAGRAAPSVAEARQLHAQEQAGQEAEARSWYERGITAEQAGKANVAKTYYEMAARRATGPLRDEILARLRGLR